MRIGLGSDIHPFVDGKAFILGGVSIPFSKGLKGHSDADALSHAIGDALLGALALGDLGKYFPDTDPQYKGISSLKLLEKIHQKVVDQGYSIANIDSVLMVEKPKLSPYIDEMREKISKTLFISPSQISIKATRGEGLGFVGREEGVFAQAIVLLEKS